MYPHKKIGVIKIVFVLYDEFILELFDITFDFAKLKHSLIAVLREVWK